MERMTYRNKASFERAYSYSNSMKLTALILLLVCVNCSKAYADGISFGQEILMESKQEAVIACSEDHETMILSTTFQDETPLANQVWIVPVFSKTPPTVEAGDINVFGELINIIGYKVFNQSSGRLVVHGTKEIDIFDVAVLEADSLSELVDWLVSNGYTVPENVRVLLQWYINKSKLASAERPAELSGLKTYFIASRIDIRNRFDDVASRLETVYPEFSAKKAYDQTTYINTALSRIYNDIKNGIAYEDSIAAILINSMDYSLLSEDYQKNKTTYSDVFNEVFSSYYSLRSMLEAFSYETLLWGYVSTGYAPTPLKIRFQPDKCFFPLRISSAAPEPPVRITVGVIAAEEVFDSSGMFSPVAATTTWQSLIRNIEDFDASKSKLAGYFSSDDVKGLNKITVLSKYMKPSEMVVDATFMLGPSKPVEPVVDPNKVDFTLYPGINFVGNPFNKNLCASSLNSGSKFYIYENNTGWQTTDCLDPCKGGILRLKNAINISISGERITEDLCANPFFDVRLGKGWNLVPFPSRIIEKMKFYERTGEIKLYSIVEPYNLDSNTKTFSSTTTEIPGKAYWIYIDWNNLLE